MSFGVTTHGATAKAAVDANGEAMRKVLNALRQAGAREIATEWVSVYPDLEQRGWQHHRLLGLEQRLRDDRRRDAAALIDAATAAGANQVSGPGLSASNAEELYRQALAKAVAEARERAEVLAKASGRSLGAISAIVEGMSVGPAPVRRAPRRGRGGLDAGRPRRAGDLRDRHRHLRPALAPRPAGGQADA